MIGRRIRLALPDDVPVRPNHKLVFHSGEEGVVIEPRPLGAWLVSIRDTAVVFFPDEIEEIPA